MSHSLAQQAQAIADTYRSYAAETPQALNSHLADKETLSILLEAFRSGLNNRDSCDAANLNQRTLQRWMEKAEADPQSAERMFVDALKRARAEGKLRRLQRIERAADDPKYWASNAWILERTDPEQFALRKDDVSVPQIVVHAEGAREVKIAIVPAGLSPANINDLACANHSQVEMLSPISGDYVNRRADVPALVSALGEPLETEIPAVESAGGPHRGGAEAGGQHTAQASKGKGRRSPRKAKKGDGGG